MNNLTIIPTAEFLSENTLRTIYKNWNKKSLATEVVSSFLQLPNHDYDYKRISQIPFNEFDFNKKVTLDDIKQETRISKFINYLLDHTQISGQDRKFRYRMYHKLFTQQIANQITQSRHYLRKQYGFGIYQFDEIKITRLGNNDEAYSTSPFVLVPTKKFCVDTIKKYYKKDIISDLVQRNIFIKKTWNKIKNVSERELTDQEEIQKALEDWKNEEVN